MPLGLTMASAEQSIVVVGVGASAGGLEALEQMFDNIPPDNRMAFVVIQHLSPDFRSLMDELLSRHTNLHIHRVENGMMVEPNSIYLIPPKKEMIISNGRLLLSDKDQNAQFTLPIDIFFRSLAQVSKTASVGIVLSGTGSDGSIGISKIHEAGGLVIVQSEESAKFSGRLSGSTRKNWPLADGIRCECEPRGVSRRASCRLRGRTRSANGF
jgi:two-component system, chemotaxis family, CheB/CheR fusion protein